MNAFVCFGDCNYQKISDLTLTSSGQLAANDVVNGWMFNSLRVKDAHFEINNVYLSWFYILYNTNSKLWHCGFKDSKNCDAELIFDSSDNDDIKTVSCGWNNVVVVTKCGKCIVFSTKDFLPIFIKEIANLKIKDASVSDMNIVLLSEDQDVYCIENLGSTINVKKILKDCLITEVCCGKEHTLLLSQNGSVYSFGTGSRGQLGHGDTNSEVKPLIIEALEGIRMKSIACGGWHSAALSTSGDLYMWGWNESGQLGLPCNQRSDNTSVHEIEAVCCLPKLVSFQPDVPVQIVRCGSRHSAAISEPGHVWTWGFNSYNQLGLPKCPWIDVPTLVSLPSSFHPRNLQCSYWNTVIFGIVDNEKVKEVSLIA